MDNMNEFDCCYNKGVICDAHDSCAKCGWNPEVSAKRVEKMKAEWEREAIQMAEAEEVWRYK